MSGVGRLALCGNVGAAVALALLSACCYATSAVLQEREAARLPGGGVVVVLRLVRRPWWWFAVVASVAAAGLHIAALALGPLSLVQPLGVLTLVLALPLGARLGRRAVCAGEWWAAVVVALGLVAVLAVAPHHAPSVHLSLTALLAAGTSLAVTVLVLAGLAAWVPSRCAPVAHAAGAAACFGFASAMARIAATGTAPFAVASVMAVLGAAAGFGLAQLAYRGGGLGAPLATQILVDPVVAVLIGVTLLNETVPLTPVRAVIGIAGLVATIAGIWALTRRPSRAEGASHGRGGSG